MSTRDPRDLTQQLSKLKRSLDDWRRGAKPPRIIPEEIWQQAVEAADEHGVGAVARHVGLDHAKLKLKLAQERPVAMSADGPSKGLAVSTAPELPASFFELLAPAEASRLPERCIVEVESGRGARMRLEVSSLETPGLVHLVREFVN